MEERRENDPIMLTQLATVVETVEWIRESCAETTKQLKIVNGSLVDHLKRIIVVEQTILRLADDAFLAKKDAAIIAFEAKKEAKEYTDYRVDALNRTVWKITGLMLGLATVGVGIIAVLIRVWA